jgi:iron-regulated transporter 1
MASNEKHQPLEQKYQLYLMHFCFAFTSRMWDMAITLLIAELTNNSLKLVAMSGLMSSALTLIAMPKIGSWLDKANRLKAAKITLFYKLTSVALAYLLCAYLNQKNGPISINSKLKTSLFYFLPILYAIAGVSFATITQQIETDWLVVLANKDENWLRTTNSVMSQIDLGCKALAPAVTGLLFAKYSQSNVSILLVGFSTLITIMFYQFINGLYYKFPNLANKESEISESTKETEKVLNNNDTNENAIFFGKEWDINEPVGKLLNVSKHFITSGCAGLMVAYSFLYLTVLSFGSLMTVYLRSTGMSQYWIGTFKGLAALTEFTGAALFPYFSRSFGDWKTGYYSIWYQFSFVLLAASSMLLLPLNKSNVIIALSVLFSRAGLWMFDLTTRQIAQVTIKESIRGRVNGQWKAIISFFDMFGYFLAVVFSHPDQFWILTTISAIMVGSAAITYSINIPVTEKLPFRFPNFLPRLTFIKRKAD